MSRHRTQPNAPQATLYAVVFGNLYVKLAVLTLFAFMLLQPVGQVMAAEDSAAAEAEPAEVVAEESESEPEPEPEPEVGEEVVAETEEEPVVDESVQSDEVLTEEEAEATEAETDIDAEPAPETAVATNDTAKKSTSSVASDDIGVTSVTKSTSTDTVLDSASSSAPVDADTSSTTPPVSVGGGSTGDDTVSTTSESVPEETATTTSTTTESEPDVVTDETTTEPVATPETPTEKPTSLADLSIGMVAGTSTDGDEVGTTTVPEAQSFVSSTADDPLHFTDTQCVSVGDGSFYCSKADVTEYSSEAAVFVELDADADKEIFFKDGFTKQQITHNQLTDMAPDYDSISHSVVWHRQIDGVYQIMHYDLASETETQLTSTDTNNMEPTHENGVTVWQRWVDNNWEIMLFDGTDELQLTHNGTHDLAPDIEGGYVIWHTSNGSEKAVAVYEIATGLTSFIDDGEGGQVSNPRYVLVYDTKFANGDIVTKGFNPETGDVVPLSAQPSERPVEVPEPEPTGESTALIQAKPPSAKEDAVEDITGTPTKKSASTQTTAAPTPVQATTTSTSTATDVVIEVLATSTPETLPLTEFDLIVEPFSEAESGTSSAQESGRGTTTDSLE